MPRKILTPEDKKFIEENRLLLSSTDIAIILGFSKTPIQKYLKDNNLTIPKEVSYQFRSEKLKGKTILTPAQDQYIKENYLKYPVKAIAKTLQTGGMVVTRRLSYFNLVIPKEIIEQRKKAGRFKPGQTSHNKGKKLESYMPAETIEKIKKTQFKKGNLPHNTNPKLGAIVPRKDSKTGATYFYIKLKHGHWKELHRYNWEQKNGPIPKNKLITFKDGNTLNPHVNNLECITKAQNAIRNIKKFRNYPQPLQQAIQYKNKLIKTLRNENQTNII